MTPTLSTTPNNSFRYPTSANNGTDFSTGLLDFADDVDGMWSAGTLVSRPAASAVKAGAVYRTTDTGGETLSASDGSVWLPLSLIPAIKSASASAVSGQAIITSGASAITITLPAHANGQIVAVKNGSTGGTTVSGSSIQGPGLSSASSFPLGAVGAFAVLIDDGTSWHFLGGQQDTGWVALTLTSGIVQGAGAYVPAARVVGDEGRLRGIIQNTSGGTITSPATVPSVARPASLVAATGATTSAGTGATLSIAATGAVTVASLPNAQSLGLDNMRYSFV